ncbi:hypothetical protein [Cohnella lubricantis]|uniref:Uncharacterized protein n=1 Tax=Cohnella lubricantis TaxID=2163172 RepID=A0A841TBR5_9BACL|nr:hypothetical protein [Cohnella lubricantis]MBB6676818.1 hypothetical protein [Cohnella lubricantis]
MDSLRVMDACRRSGRHHWRFLAIVAHVVDLFAFFGRFLAIVAHVVDLFAFFGRFLAIVAHVVDLFAFIDGYSCD